MQQDETVLFFKRSIEDEIIEICENLIDVVQKLMNAGEKMMTITEHVCYLKMQGDYSRYMCEVSGEKKIKDRANAVYKQAISRAQDLRPSNSLRLGLLLNCSVFFYESLGQHELACKIARDAFNKAVDDLEGLHEDDYVDTTMIMELINDNLLIWSNTDAKESGKENTKTSRLLKRSESVAPPSTSGDTVIESALEH